MGYSYFFILSFFFCYSKVLWLKWLREKVVGGEGKKKKKKKEKGDKWWDSSEIEISYGGWVEQELIERVRNKERKKRKGKEMREVSDDLSEGGEWWFRGECGWGILSLIFMCRFLWVIFISLMRSILNNKKKGSIKFFFELFDMFSKIFYVLKTFISFLLFYFVLFCFTWLMFNYLKPILSQQFYFINFFSNHLFFCWFFSLI